MEGHPEVGCSQLAECKGREAEGLGVLVRWFLSDGWWNSSWIKREGRKERLTGWEKAQGWTGQGRGEQCFRRGRGLSQQLEGEGRGAVDGPTLPQS